MDTQGSKNCEEIRNLLPDYSVGAITAYDQLLVEQHLSNCAGCSAELMALERVGALLHATLLEPAPDLWYSIKRELSPRHQGLRIGDLVAWFGTHRFQSAAAAMLMTAAIGAWLLVVPQQPTEAEARSYIAHHASLNWREPFADKVGLGLADTPYTPVDVEAAR